MAAEISIADIVSPKTGQVKPNICMARYNYMGKWGEKRLKLFYDVTIKKFMILRGISRSFRKIQSI